jgi:hypothetical protein
VYDLETSRIAAPYIYDISNLRVNKYTRILEKYGSALLSVEAFERK